jgi:hypothetical protein
MDSYGVVEVAGGLLSIPGIFFWLAVVAGIALLTNIATKNKFVWWTIFLFVSVPVLWWMYTQGWWPYVSN